MFMTKITHQTRNTQQPETKINPIFTPFFVVFPGSSVKHQHPSKNNILTT
jgi:hypothetical protein